MGKKEKEKEDSEWIVQVESSLEEETRPDKSHQGFIHTVPKCLVCNKTRLFYHPQVISFGPYHFRKEDVPNDDMELLKSEVARKMHLKIIWKGGLKSVMEKFREKIVQDRIKQSYANEFKLSSEVCAWMMVRDACFLLEVLHRFGKGEDPGETVPVFMDSILSRERHHPLLTEIVKDMLKMENQLPFWVLKKIRFEILGSNDDIWFESALKFLSPIKVAEGRNREYHKESHILQLLHDYIVDTDRQVPASSNLQSVGCGIKELNFHKIMPRSIRRKWLFALIFFPVFVVLSILGIIFVILHYIKNHIFDILYSIVNCLSHREEETEKHVPSIVDLRRGGMKFKKLEGGISQIKFNKNNSTLYLPEFKVDDRSEVILRNLIALEICSQEKQKPITRYAILMNDLVDRSRDVEILRLEDIITGKLGTDDEISKLWNSMVSPTEMPRLR
ncbi:putative UPF0481 protein At3g02645 isoform X3 [Cryptomeria japonica]|uniref:putative UPF0481 protein At3g02645 isoform X3 n=1 Tax=Cryptomeria japonica TaxID=3369 RepID=UPI0025AC7D83|nr:putative UPF0481 protein At3g02645 isoform X3 [Cryptomeria japonica]